MPHIPKIELLTPDEASRMLRLTVKRVHDLVRTGKLGCVQVSVRERLFLPEHIEEFVESRTVAVPRKKIDKSTAEKLSLTPRGLTAKKSMGDLSLRGELREEVRSWR